MNVIVFESEEDIVDLLSYNLEKNGFQVRSCNSSIMNCSCLDTYEPQLVIIGNVGIDEDLIGFTKGVRAAFQQQNPVVLCLTTDAAHMTALNKSGLFDKVLSTPITPKSLIKEVNQLCNIPVVDSF